ncbi:MAG TPA: VWA domain-containing protein [Pyrinomonadaceae bacterium]
MRTELKVKFLILVCLCFASLRASAQIQKPSPSPRPADDVIRINTELVQTDVMVFDKSGKFVSGLSRDHFELSVDGKPQPISFFEQVRAGTPQESRLLSAASNPTAVPESPAVNENRGRTIVFFIDDLHLSPDSLARTRKTLAQFIDNEMNENDRVAIASTSGDIGFLQQFTDYKSVLRAAAGRLTHHAYNVRDMTDSRTPMTENMALAIERKDDPGVLQFYIDRCLQEAYPLRYKRETCDVQVKSRARLILLQAASVTLNTYASLESLMRSATLLPGRKLVFFISDGFLLDTGPRNADPRDKLRQITDTALHAGVVIYTIDARGLFSGQLDATNNVPFDPQNRLESTSLREGPTSQDALNALASDTGGRALRNQNYFDRWVNKILDETSEYYLLAWRPNNQEESQTNFKNLAVRVIDHPEYSVRLPRGFVNPTTNTPPATPTSEIQGPAQSHRDLQQAMTALNPKHELPTSLSAVFFDTPDNGAVLTASVQVANEALSYAAAGGKQTAAIDVAGVVVNDRGKPAGSFQTRLNIDPLGDHRAAENSSSIYNSRLRLAPGLYQVRVATRDFNSGRIGSAQQWVEIPDLRLRRLTLSSLLLGLQTVGQAKGDSGSPQVQFNVDHRFARNGRLGFAAFVYNANQGGSISFQARILKMGQPVATTRWQTVSMSSQDAARILCNGELSLDSIPAGQYMLELIVTDDVLKTSASEQTRITVE